MECNTRLLENKNNLYYNEFITAFNDKDQLGIDSMVGMDEGFQ